MKRNRLIATISLMILCLSILCVGVIAANGVPEVETGGVININANKIGIRVTGYINCYKNGVFTPSETPDFDSAESDGKWEFSVEQLNEMTFDMFGVDESNKDEQQIQITFVIENNSDLALHAYFKKPVEVTETNPTGFITYTAGQTDELYNEGENPAPTIETTFGEILVIPAKSQNNNISLVFSPLTLVDDLKRCPFNYTLEVEETSPTAEEQNPETEQTPETEGQEQTPVE